MIKNLFNLIVLLFMTWAITSFALMEMNPLKWTPLGRLILIIIAIYATSCVVKENK